MFSTDRLRACILLYNFFGKTHRSCGNKQWSELVKILHMTWCICGSCEGNPLVTAGFPSQGASIGELRYFFGDHPNNRLKNSLDVTSLFGKCWITNIRHWYSNEIVHASAEYSGLKLTNRKIHFSGLTENNPYLKNGIFEYRVWNDVVLWSITPICAYNYSTKPRFHRLNVQNLLSLIFFLTLW